MPTGLVKPNDTGSDESRRKLQYILQLRQRRKKKRGVREDIEMREKKSSIVAHDLKVAPIAKGHEQLRRRMDRDATYIFLKMA